MQHGNTQRTIVERSARTACPRHCSIRLLKNYAHRRFRRQVSAQLRAVSIGLMDEEEVDVFASHPLTGYDVD